MRCELRDAFVGYGRQIAGPGKTCCVALGRDSREGIMELCHYRAWRLCGCIEGLVT